MKRRHVIHWIAHCQRVRRSRLYWIRHSLCWYSANAGLAASPIFFAACDRYPAIFSNWQPPPQRPSAHDGSGGGQIGTSDIRHLPPRHIYTRATPKETDRTLPLNNESPAHTQRKGATLKPQEHRRSLYSVQRKVQEQRTNTPSTENSNTPSNSAGRHARRPSS